LTEEALRLRLARPQGQRGAAAAQQAAREIFCKLASIQHTLTAQPMHSNAASRRH